MIYKDIKKEFDYILWLRERIKKLRFGISHRVKVDSSTDFEMLTRKLKDYEQEYELLVYDLYLLLKDYGLSGKINNYPYSS
ncbi:MAG: hypothetical protein WC564_01380 [Patescibacteria group bacterium]